MFTFVPHKNNFEIWNLFKSYRVQGLNGMNRLSTWWSPDSVIQPAHQREKAI